MSIVVIDFQQNIGIEYPIIIRIQIKKIMMDDDHEMFKIVVIGSSGTGKTNIATRYIKNEFSETSKATVGVEFFSKIVKVHNQNIKIALWDTAGQEKYKSLSKVYYKGSSGVLIVYDATDPQSYLDVQSWMRLANQNLNISQVALMVVGNKVDLEDQRKVPNQRPLREYKDKFDIDCWEVSAKTGYNVKEVFAQLIEKIYQMHMGPKGSHIPFGDSQIGDSIVEGPESLIGVKKPVNNNYNNRDTRISKQIPEVVLEQEQPHIDMTKKKKTDVTSPSQPKTVQSKSAQKPELKKEPNTNVKLNVKDENKKTKQKKQKSKGCC